MVEHLSSGACCPLLSVEEYTVCQLSRSHTPAPYAKSRWCESGVCDRRGRRWHTDVSKHTYVLCSREDERGRRTAG